MQVACGGLAVVDHDCGQQATVAVLLLALAHRAVKEKHRCDERAPRVGVVPRLSAGVRFCGLFELVHWRSVFVCALEIRERGLHVHFLDLLKRLAHKVVVHVREGCVRHSDRVVAAPRRVLHVRELPHVGVRLLRAPKAFQQEEATRRVEPHVVRDPVPKVVERCANRAGDLVPPIRSKRVDARPAAN